MERWKRAFLFLCFVGGGCTALKPESDRVDAQVEAGARDLGWVDAPPDMTGSPLGLHGGFVGGGGKATAQGIELRGHFLWHAAHKVSNGGITLEGGLR